MTYDNDSAHPEEKTHTAAIVQLVSGLAMTVVFVCSTMLSHRLAAGYRILSVAMGLDGRVKPPQALLPTPAHLPEVGVWPAPTISPTRAVLPELPVLSPPPLAVDPPFWARHGHEADEMVRSANYTITVGCARFYDRLYPTDLIQRTHVETGNFWEPEELQVLSGYLPDGAVVFDIGANIGNHALYWALKVNTHRVYAFEPIPATFALLSRNVEINALSGKLIPINAAVGDVQERVAIKSYTVRNTGGATVRTDRLGTIPCIRLDDFEFSEQRVDLLKIDVEGFECRTVSGARNFIMRFHPKHIFIEVVGDDHKEWIARTFSELCYREIRSFGSDNLLYEFDELWHQRINHLTGMRS
jgi:FkbM family methyltransferase